MLSLIAVCLGVSTGLVGAALYLFVFHHSSHVRRLGTVSLEVDGYRVESDIRAQWLPFISSKVYEEFKVLDEDNYYVFREKHVLPLKEKEEI